LATKSNVASTLLLVWTGLYSDALALFRRSYVCIAPTSPVNLTTICPPRFKMLDPSLLSEPISNSINSGVTSAPGGRSNKVSSPTESRHVGSLYMTPQSNYFNMTTKIAKVVSSRKPY